MAGFDYRDWSIATIFSGPTTAAELPCFVLPVASLPGGVQPRCLSIVSQARFFFFFLLALFGLPLQRTWYLLFVRVWGGAPSLVFPCYVPAIFCSGLSWHTLIGLLLLFVLLFGASVVFSFFLRPSPWFASSFFCHSLFSLSMYPLGCWRAYVVPVVPSTTMAWHCIVYSPYSITIYYWLL